MPLPLSLPRGRSTAVLATAAGAAAVPGPRRRGSRCVRGRDEHDMRGCRRGSTGPAVATRAFPPTVVGVRGTGGAVCSVPSIRHGACPARRVLLARRRPRRRRAGRRLVRLRWEAAQRDGASRAAGAAAAAALVAARLVVVMVRHGPRARRHRRWGCVCCHRGGGRRRPSRRGSSTAPPCAEPHDGQHPSTSRCVGLLRIVHVRVRGVAHGHPTRTGSANQGGDGRVRHRSLLVYASARGLLSSWWCNGVWVWDSRTGVVPRRPKVRSGQERRV